MATSIDPTQAPFPYEGEFQRFFEKAPPLTPEQRTGWTKQDYLRLAEPMLRCCAHWQKADGSLWDADMGAEQATGTVRYAAAVIMAVEAGICQDLLSSGLAALDHCVREFNAFANDKTLDLSGPDFYLKELVVALRHCRGLVDDAQWSSWRDLLQVSPWRATNTGRGIASHNWWAYALVGEFLRETIGLQTDMRFVETGLEHLLSDFTPEGMYRDPGDPITYDLTVRQNLAILRDAKYQGRYRAQLDELLRRGVLMTAFYQSTTGQMPYGGRSNQFHIMEAMAASFAESQARWFSARGQRRLAGACKRLAHTAARCCERWLLDPRGPFSLKNCYDPARQIGIHMHQGRSVYGILAANLLLATWHNADESIHEDTIPTDLGGHGICVAPAFNHVWASCGPYHVQTALSGELRYDATGLGRLQHRDAPLELVLSASIAADPFCTVASCEPQSDVAIGPVWQDDNGHWHSLAEQRAFRYPTCVKFLQNDRSEVIYTITYALADPLPKRISERYHLTPEGLKISWLVDPIPISLRIQIPILLTDGEARSDVCFSDGTLRVHYRGWICQITSTSKVAPLKVRDGGNQNGLYAVYAIYPEPKQSEACLHFQIWQ